MSHTRLAAIVLAVAGVVGTATIVSAQDQGQQPQQPQQQQQQDNGGGRRGGFGGPGGFDPAQMRQRMMDRLKEQLDVKDDEWAVMQPRLEKVMTLSFESRMGGMRGMFGRGGRNRGGDNNNNPQANNPVAKAQEDLRTTLDDKNASADTIAAKLKALRDARAQAKEELTKAQSDLKEILSQRQEAQLVMMGYLE